MLKVNIKNKPEYKLVKSKGKEARHLLSIRIFQNFVKKWQHNGLPKIFLTLVDQPTAKETQLMEKAKF